MHMRHTCSIIMQLWTSLVSFNCRNASCVWLFHAGPQQLLTNSQWRSSAAIVSVDLTTGGVARLSPDDGAAWSLLDHGNGAPEEHKTRPILSKSPAP